MVFGFTKRDRRVPDLSRYDYYYQNHEDYNKSPQLSAAAASAASAASPDRTNYSRSHSLVSHAPSIPRQRSSVKSPGRRLSTSSAAPPTSRAAAKQYSQKTYSLRSQRSGEYHLHPPGYTTNGSRMNSMTSGANVRRNYGKNKSTAGNNNDSRANSITVKTTQVTGPSGRTQSITKKTIRKINGYEYVETTTTTKNLVPLGDSQRHFDEFSENYMLQDDDILEEQASDNIHDIIEENETDNEKPYSPVSESHLQDDSELNVEKPDFPPGSYFHHKYSTDVMPLEEESSLSNFSDALDYIPPTHQTSSKYIHNKRKQASTTRRKKRPPAVKNAEAEAKKPLTEAEMYLKALEVAKRNVYHTDAASDNASAPLGSNKSRKSRMGQKMTLRSSSDSPTATANLVKSNVEVQPKRFTSSFFSRNTKSAPHEVHNHSVSTHFKSNKAVDPVPEPKSANTGLTDKEMYDQALKIAQARYYNSHGIQPEAVDNSTTAAKPRQVGVSHLGSTGSIPPNEQHYLGDSEIPVQSEVHEYEPIPLQKTKTTGSSKNKFKTMFDKVLKFSQENYGYQHKKEQGEQTPVTRNAEESFPAASISEGVTTAKPSSNEGVMTNPVVTDSPSPLQQQIDSTTASSNGQSQGNVPTSAVASTTRTRSPELQDTLKSSSSLLQDQTPQRQEDATDPTTSSTNELSAAEPTMVTSTHATKTIQAQTQNPPTKHKKSSFFTKLFKKKSSR